jgi:hypothetical protein
MRALQADLGSAGTAGRSRRLREEATAIAQEHLNGQGSQNSDSWPVHSLRKDAFMKGYRLVAARR